MIDEIFGLILSDIDLTGMCCMHTSQRAHTQIHIHASGQKGLQAKGHIFQQAVSLCMCFLVLNCVCREVVLQPLLH